MEAEVRAILSAAVSEPDPSRTQGLAARYVCPGVLRVQRAETSVRPDAAALCGDIRAGAPIDGFDAQRGDLPSSCRHSATRNVKDFDQTGIDVVDPWREGGSATPDAS